MMNAVDARIPNLGIDDWLYKRAMKVFCPRRLLVPIFYMDLIKRLLLR